MLIIKKIILRIIIVNEEIKECYIPVFQFLKDLGITNKECNNFKEMLKNGYNGSGHMGIWKRNLKKTLKR